MQSINLGLVEVHNPKYKIKEKLSSVRVELNGDSYTYNYNETEPNNKNVGYNVPTINMQVSSKVYSSKIYPSDIVYNIENGGNKLKVYVTYSIIVTNNEKMDLDYIYKEQKLYITSLKNRFDNERYTLDDGKWNLNSSGEAEFKNITESEFSNGINKGKSISTTIQFKIKDKALEDILNNNTIANEEKSPTIAIANGYHDYLRKDNVWNSGLSAKSWGTDTLEDGEFFLHRSINKIVASPALYINIDLSNPRTISGLVFEDNKSRTIKDNEGNEIQIGDGIYNENENIARNIKVELLKKESINDYSTVEDLTSEDPNIVDLYIRDGNSYKKIKAQTITNDEGKFEFQGVVPGYYYLRFTYGDGKQKIYTINGDKKVSDIYARDYKSTVINNQIVDIIQNAKNLPSDNTDKDKLQWYKNLDNSLKYSVALDNLQLKDTYSNNIYSEDGKNTNMEDDAVTLKAFTPRFYITIENDINNSRESGGAEGKEFSNFNFGIEHGPKTIIDIEKKIVDIEMITQAGTSIVYGNPKNNKSKYISDLDQVTENGSKLVKIETDIDKIYGTEIKLVYELSVKNNSQSDYINNNFPEKYYYYGIIDNDTYLKKVNIHEIEDYVDDKFNIDFNQEIQSTSGDEIKLDDKDKSVKMSILGNATPTTLKTMSITGWNYLKIGETKAIRYSVSSLLSKDNDEAFYNNAQVKRIGLDRLISLQSDFKWEEDSTSSMIVPPTGKNKDNIYIIVGIVSLIIISIGIIFIKKQVIDR